jgi:membrane-associated protease RseP (regulator of RpoE activity)
VSRHLRPTALAACAPVGALLGALLAALLLGGAGCTTAPLAPIPEPLPEALAWQAAASSGAFLGLKTEENDSGSLDALFFKPGARVTRIIENSPASAAGLRAGDVVLALDGAAVNDPGALDAAVAGHAPGAHVTLSVQRGDTVFDVPAVLAASGGATVNADAASAQPRYRPDPARSRAGWATSPSGVVLTSFAPGSPCDRAGLHVGDVVTAVDGEPVLSDRELIRRFATHEPGDRVQLTVRAGPSAASGTTPSAPAAAAPRDVTLMLQEQPTRVTGVKVPILFSWESSPDGKHGSFDVIDLWVLSLFHYEREEHERHYTILTLFGWHAFTFSVGEGELGP